jgi:hypothetical protein
MPKITLKKIIKAFLPYGILYLLNRSKIIDRVLAKINFASKKNISKIDVPENCILVVEVFESHGEILPGLAKYLLELGYRVDVIMASSDKNIHSSRNDVDIFSRFHDDKLRIFRWPSLYVLDFLHGNKWHEYKYIVINTYNSYTLKNLDIFKLKPICMIHNNSDSTNEYGKTNKIISLVKMDCFDREPPPVVNAHYFGEFLKRKKTEITEFIAFGNTDGAKRRNINLIIKTYEYLKNRNIKNYKIKLIGDNNFIVPDECKDNIQSLGFITFPELYKAIEQVDFILALIDPASIEYTNKASGVYQLSYGFLKPILIHEKFREIGGFTCENSIREPLETLHKKIKT